jgi:hypothetical protein
MRKYFWIQGFVFSLVAGSWISAASVVYTGNFSQPIPAVGDGHGWMDPVTIDVDKHFEIQDLNISLTISHPEVGDLRILLDSPWGTSILLKDSWLPSWSAKRSNLAGTIFDDEAPAPLELGTPPYPGAFQSLSGQYLSAFDGYDVFGQWTLRIEDVYYADAGTLQQWSLIIESPHAPEPAGMILIATGLLFLRHYRIRVKKS